MDRRVVFGVVGVAVLGGALAVLAVVGTGVGTMPRSEPSPPVPPPVAATRVEVAPEAAPAGPPDRLEAARMANEPTDTTPRQPPPPPDPQVVNDTFGPFDRRHEQLLHEPAFRDLPPDAEAAVIAERVDEAVDEVHELAASYWEIGKSGDPALRAEALHRASVLYDHLVDELPPPAMQEPGESGPSVWDDEARQTMAETLRRKAEGLRKAAVEPLKE